MIALNKIAAIGLLCIATVTATAAMPRLLNDPVDISSDFHNLANFYYLADKVSAFNPATHSGKIIYQRSQCRIISPISMRCRRK